MNLTKQTGGTGQGGLWGIVLAAGKGSRLRAMTTVDDEAVPKQFCSLRGDVSMLRRAWQRAARLVPERNIRVVVAAEHRKWWSRELADLGPRSVVVQPADKGTAAGVLLPLTAVLRQDPAGVVILLPADHHVGDERILQTALQRAVAAVAAHPERVILLGMTPEDSHDADYGWIVPRRGELPFAPSAVERFREKPPVAEAAALRIAGGLVSSFVLVARASALRQLYEQRLADLAARFLGWRGDPSSLSGVYGEIPARDFSRDLLEPSVGQLWVVRVPPCGWSDLGTPERVAHCLASHRPEPAPSPWQLRHGFVPPVDLSRRLARV